MTLSRVAMTFAVASMAAASMGTTAGPPSMVSGAWTGPEAEHVAVTAVDLGNGLTHGQLQGVVGPGLGLGRGQITCMSISGNKAYLSGVITRFDPNPAAVGAGFIVRLTDDGVGPGSADSLTLIFFTKSVLDCHDPQVQQMLEALQIATAGGDRFIVSGNITVRE